MHGRCSVQRACDAGVAAKAGKDARGGLTVALVWGGGRCCAGLEVGCEGCGEGLLCAVVAAGCRRWGFGGVVAWRAGVGGDGGL